MNKTQPKRTRRASLTRSKLRAPDSIIYSLAAEFQNYMHLPDPMPLYVLMGALAGNMLVGQPLWVMFVGDSSSGKTMLLESLLDVPFIRRVSSINGEAALLSGVKKKERATDATGGLLREMQWGTDQGFGCVVFSDFTSVLSMQQEAMKTIIKAFREVYDGYWVRDIGGEGGRTLEWEGQIAVLAGVTYVIDRHQAAISEMGDRFLYYRFPETDGYQESRTAANTTDPPASKTARREMVARSISALGLAFDHKTPRRELLGGEIDRIIGLAQLGSRARTAITRDHYAKDVIEVPRPEVSTRMTVEMVQLYLGCEAVGLDAEDRWKVLEKIAIDSIPATRNKVFEAVLKPAHSTIQRNGSGNKTLERGRPSGDIQRAVKCGKSTVEREVENLMLLGLIKNTPSGWVATDWTRERLGWIRPSGDTGAEDR